MKWYILQWKLWWYRITACNDDYAFLRAVGNVLLVPTGFCFLVFLAGVVSLGQPSSVWSCAGALISTAAIDLITISTSHLPDARRTHTFRTLLMMAFVLYTSVLVQSALPELVALTATLMMLLMVFSNRFMESNLYAMWRRPEQQRMASFQPSVSHVRENVLALGVAGVGFGLWWGSAAAPWLLPSTLVALCALHRIRVWRTPRKNVPLSLEQHTSVWPRKAQRNADVLLWGSMLMYNHSWSQGIPYTAIEKTCAKMQVDGLLAYFHYFPVHPEAHLQPTKDLTLAIIARLQELDARATVIFDMQSNDFHAAAQTFKDMRANNIVPQEAWELPEL